MSISLKPSQKDDWDTILELRNEFYSMFYKQTSPISQKEHYGYMENQMSNPNFHHWMILYNNEIAGYARILDNDVGIMIKKEYQNKGIATKALAQIEILAKKMGLKKLVALVKIENEESKKIFLANDYKLKMYWYEKDLS